MCVCVRCQKPVCKPGHVKICIELICSEVALIDFSPSLITVWLKEYGGC